jgi:hypothetical protein
MYPKNVPMNKNIESRTGIKIFAGTTFGKKDFVVLFISTSMEFAG